MPPITLRALPHPRGQEADISVSREDETYVVEVTAVGGDAPDTLDPNTIRFGYHREVNRAGASPTSVSNAGGHARSRVPG